MRNPVPNREQDFLFLPEAITEKEYDYFHDKRLA